jgi:hypothetical protein
MIVSRLAQRTSLLQEALERERRNAEM